MSSCAIPEQLRVERLALDEYGTTICASTSTLAVDCPVCGRTSRRIYGCYGRTLADLALGGVPVRLRVRVRKFFCDEPSCGRRIFTERLREVARPFVRGTDRQKEALERIAFALGGEAGARLVRELGLLVSPDTLLNRIRGALCANLGGARVVGVNDFAFKRGDAYGTILVDLERHKVVDLLPERSAEPLERWLKEHASVEVVARDRSHVYARGIAASAPRAKQVADRWHLLHGLALALEGFLLQKRPALRKAATLGNAPEPAQKAAEAEDDVAAPGPASPNRPRLWYARQEEAANKRHERLVEQCKEIWRLYLAGMDLREIHRTLGVSVRTVYRYKDLTEPPPRPAYKRRASVLDPYVPYLVRRWNEGCHNARQLYREIREQGYSHSRTNVERLLAEFRRAEARGNPASSVPRAKKGAVAGSLPSVTNVAALFMRREEKLTVEQEAYLERLQALDPALADARRLTQQFAGMTRNLGGDDLDGWLRRRRPRPRSCDASPPG